MEPRHPCKMTNPELNGPLKIQTLAIPWATFMEANVPLMMIVPCRCPTARNQSKVIKIAFKTGRKPSKLSISIKRNC